MNFKLSIVLALLLTINLTSCSEKGLSEIETEQADQLMPQKKSVKNSELVERFKSNLNLETGSLKLKSSSSKQSSENFQVNLNNVYEVDNVGATGSRSIFVEGKLNGNDVALFKVLNRNDKLTEEYFICETLKENDDLYIVNYYNSDLKKLYSVDIIPSKSKVSVHRNEISTIYKAQAGARLNKKAGGQEVMDCINDAYSNHGWVSVAAWIQTAFIPATAVAIAGACTGLNA